MSIRELVFLGAAPGAAAEVIVCEGTPLKPGDRQQLVQRRSAWPETRDHVRIIVGTHRERADLLLGGPGLRAENLRFYIPREGSGPTDLKVIHEESTRVDGKRIAPDEWVTLEGGEEIELAGWRWRFEMSDRGER